MSVKHEGMPSQALILAAGENSRFVPFNSRKSHKSMFEVMGVPIIAQTVTALQRAGIQEILVIKSPGDTSIQETLSAGDQSKTKLSFYDQKKPLGMGNALLEAEGLLQDRFLVINPQQINIDQHLQSLDDVPPTEVDDSLVLFSQKTDEPKKYGMLGLDGRKVTRVVEKPNDLTDLSDQRILGMYILDMDFLHFMSGLETSEYQLELALDKYAQVADVIAIPSTSQTLSLKYAWDLFSIAHYKFSEFPETPQIHPGAYVHPTAILTGAVIVEEGAKIYEYAIVQGPCYIGRDAVVGSYCKVRKESILEKGVELQNNVEVKHSVLGSGTHIHSGFIGDSIVGSNVRIGAEFVTANRRLDRQNVRVPIKGQQVDTKTSFFGALIGDDAKIGIHCGTNPGTIIPAGSEIMPMTIVSTLKSSEGK